MPSRLRADFQPHELSAVMARYEIGAIEQLEKQLKGSRRSPKVIITSDRGKFLLKRRARGRDHPVKVASSHHVQQHLADQAFPLPRLVSVRDGSDTLVMLDGMIYEMFEYVPGGPYDQSVDATRDAGLLLARFHAALRTYELEWEPSRRGYHDSQPVRSNLSGVPTSIGKDDSVAGRESELLTTVNVLFDAYEAAAEKVNDAGYYQWPTQLVHSDWHPGNMLFQGGRVAAVIDYDSLHLLPPITDVANGSLQFSILGGPIDPRQWPAELDEKRLRAFFSGYDSHQSVRPEQLEVLPRLMIEALIAEAVLPIAATGSFGRMEGFRFLQMVGRKVHWLEQNAGRLVSLLRA